MSALPKYWNQLTTIDFKSLDPSSAVAVLPLAATEQHGPHLPLSVDTDIIDAVVKEGLKHLQPQDPVFVSGTLSLSAQTMLQIGAELGACIAKSGVRKLLLLNSHGGNVGLMDLIARDLRGKHSLMVFSTSWYQLPLSDEAWSGFSDHERRYGVHAGDIETSLMLHIAPERVNMNEAKDFPSASEQRARDFLILGDGKSTKLGWHIQDYNESGAVGRANAATPEKGAQLLSSAGERLGHLLKELIAIAPISG